MDLTRSPRKASFTDRSYDTLSFRIKGNATYTHENDNFLAKNNDIVFVPKKHNYFFTANESEELFAIHFNDETPKFDSIQVFSPKNPKLFRNLFEKLYNAYNLKHTGYKYNALSLFYKILEEMQIDIAIAREFSGRFYVLPTEAVVTYVQKHPTDLSVGCSSALNDV